MEVQPRKGLAAREPRTRYAAWPSRDTTERLRSFDSLSSTPTMRSNTCGGGPSIDSKATVAPLPPARAKEPLAAPPPAQPPSPQAIAISANAIAVRGAIQPARNRVVKVNLMRRAI